MRINIRIPMPRKVLADRKYTTILQPFGVDVYKRQELFISTKAGHDMWPGPYGEWGSRKYLMSSLNQSLKRMNLEYRCV